jgi:tRNA(Arg) A34 adenosine deaminase TadA
MKKICLMFAMIAALFSSNAFAEVNITKVDRINPTDEVFMDMALTAARNSVENGGARCGAVVILNGAWRSTGLPSDTITAEENAIAKSRRKTLSNATIYTINEPTTQAYNAICRAGADAIYFVNSRDVVIEKGIYPAEAYNDDEIDTEVTQVPLNQIPFEEASKFIE